MTPSQPLKTVINNQNKALAYKNTELELSPTGQLFISLGHESFAEGCFGELADSFRESSGAGLLTLGFFKKNVDLPISMLFWQTYAEKFFATLRHREDIEEKREKLKIAFPEELVEEFLAAAPPLPGGEYLRPAIMSDLWLEMAGALCQALSGWKGTVKEYFVSRNPAWHQVDRLCFNLAENKKRPDLPFAFMATYTSGLSATGQPRHLPLKNALEEYSGAGNSKKLVELLQPLSLACEKSGLLKKLLASKQVFYPLGWSPGETYRFLRDIPVFEEAGILCRVPDWWKNRSRTRLTVQARIGEKSAGMMSCQTLIDFSVGMAIGEQEITPEEWQEIRSKTDSLVMVRGNWVELDREKLDQVLEHWQKMQAAAGVGGLGFVEAMRLLAGAPRKFSEAISADVVEWSRIVPGEHLRQTLELLRQPENIQALLPDEKDVKAVLRPYQQTGIKWLGFMHRLGLGSCLADDMGLGKTLQILAFLVARKNARPAGEKHLPSLLVVPASLLGNWESEIQRFTPSVRYQIAHPSTNNAKNGKADFAGYDLVITTYGFLPRNEVFHKQQWELVILDEAQAIKNPGTRQTRAVKSLKSHNRLVLTGTPVENRLGDLWSIFDFLNPGLLGSAAEFSRFAKTMGETAAAGYAPLRNLVRPYILRRMKTDKNVIADLPEKTEVKSLCQLSKMQAVLYQESVESLALELQTVDQGIQRKGLVLAYLMRLKQICNHPSQWLKDQAFTAKDSGKFLRLAEICEEISSRNEKVLIFTQFKEMTEQLAAFCNSIFGRPGLVLHGQTPVKARKELVRRFQEDPALPFFVVSLKAGGTGLNLTAAAHVIHFDRWWNPAVENQATDRAFRIGQKKNVLVHKFVCRGTVEEKIDAMIEKKQNMSNEVLQDSAEAVLTTEMSDHELLKFVSLDLAKTVVED